MGDILYYILVLAIVALVLYLSYRASKALSRQSLKMGGADYMRVVDRLAVGTDRFILIVEIQGKYYLLAVTGQTIQTLETLDGFQENAPQLDEGPKSFGDNFKAALQDRLTRKK